MAAINTINPNVTYNYQKVPGLVTSNKAQSQAGLAIAMRDDPQSNRNINFMFPNNLATPNNGAGSPTLLAIRGPKPISEYTYAGSQLPY